MTHSRGAGKTWQSARFSATPISFKTQPIWRIPTPGSHWRIWPWLNQSSSGWMRTLMQSRRLTRSILTGFCRGHKCRPFSSSESEEKVWICRAPPEATKG